jgi:hypothetical protein
VLERERKEGGSRVDATLNQDHPCAALSTTETDRHTHTHTQALTNLGKSLISGGKDSERSRSLKSLHEPRGGQGRGKGLEGPSGDGGVDDVLCVCVWECVYVLVYVLVCVCW